eukprot:GHRR01015582.1.p1 GENE.GHRR01015582.1~~GHRR01015582.1.p1  ORF type:complete len:159 (-),score=16.99 GHRR01015582.1:1956-2432(-)
MPLIDSAPVHIHVTTCRQLPVRRTFNNTLQLQGKAQVAFTKAKKLQLPQYPSCLVSFPQATCACLCNNASAQLSTSTISASSCTVNFQALLAIQASNYGKSYTQLQRIARRCFHARCRHEDALHRRRTSLACLDTHQMRWSIKRTAQNLVVSGSGNCL